MLQPRARVAQVWAASSAAWGELLFLFCGASEKKRSAASEKAEHKILDPFAKVTLQSDPLRSAFEVTWACKISRIGTPKR